jgi:hypothetical protein
MSRRLAFLIVILAVIPVLLGGYWLYMTAIFNPRVVEEIRSDPEGPRAGIFMLLTWPGGRSIPVNYLREGDTVFVGSDGLWWRAFRDGGAPVTLEIRGETLRGLAKVVLDDPEYKRDVFARLRPNVPKWLPDRLDAKLVVITLDPPIGQ